MKPKPKDVLSPLAACVLFGKSGEAVRRAIKTGHVASFALEFSSKRAIHLIDLESAKAYWMRGERASYLGSLSAEIERMRFNGITISKSNARTSYRILHPFELMLSRSLAKQLDVTVI